MSKIVFVNPTVDKYSTIKLCTFEVFDHINGKKMSMIPKLAPMVLAAVTPQKHNFTYIDEDIEELDIDNTDADLVALTAVTAQANRAYEIAAGFRKRGIKVAIGGIHASVLPDEALRYADSVFIGESENSWIAMLEDFEAGSMNQRYEAKDYPPVEKLVSPRVDIIKHDQYLMFPLMATKGCPYDCEFCSIKFSSGNKMRMKPVEQVMEEIDAFEKHNTGLLRKTYQFNDDNLYVNRDYTIKLFKALKEKNIFWHGQGTMNTAKDDEVLHLMYESGCRIYSIGLESISETCLKEVNKTKTNKIAEYEEALKNLTRHGIHPSAFFIFGFDGDNKTVFKETMGFIEKNRIISPFFSILTPYPGTRLYDRLEPRIIDRDWASYNVTQCVFTPALMTPDELNEGAYWACYMAGRMETVKKNKQYMWRHKPDDIRKPMRFRERLILLGVALKLLQKKEYRKYAKFVLWAAMNRHAEDISLILAIVAFDKMTEMNFEQSALQFELRSPSDEQ
ncbi:MAG: B12-binding domain-containing radical SAM protein [Oscillospiraceae bacterium]|jgi:radical SAM superfamily enzyme YgiQ (UPF0313 family)|nr:B12-binding domain-containing radical SAM protein [Oscillospiraceae bacterium]